MTAQAAKRAFFAMSAIRFSEIAVVVVTPMRLLAVFAVMLLVRVIADTFAADIAGAFERPVFALVFVRAGALRARRVHGRTFDVSASRTNSTARRVFPPTCQSLKLSARICSGVWQSLS